MSLEVQLVQAQWRSLLQSSCSEGVVPPCAKCDGPAPATDCACAYRAWLELELARVRAPPLAIDLFVSAPQCDGCSESEAPEFACQLARWNLITKK